MFTAWTAVYLRTESFRKASIATLLVGKSFAIVYALAGLDRPVLEKKLPRELAEGLSELRR